MPSAGERGDLCAVGRPGGEVLALAGVGEGRGVGASYGRAVDPDRQETEVPASPGRCGPFLGPRGRWGLQSEGSWAGF